MAGKEKPIRIGVIGVGRGQSFAKGAGPDMGLELVALCDTWEEGLKKWGQQLGAATYSDYDRFLEHDMDAVVLANYFHQHAPFAIKALGAGKHVMSETSACFTLAEGVALIEAVERSGKIYMFAENYPYSAANQEMRRLYGSGRIGAFRYGEAEYVHPMSACDLNRISPGLGHWRNWIPATYYCTHALAPIMAITNTWPAKVNAFVIPHDFDDREMRGKTARRSDMASAIMVRMQDGSIAKLLQVGLRGHGVWVRIHGNRGLMETLRWGAHGMLRVRREPFDKDEGEPEELIYAPDFPEHHEEALRAGHGGGDFFMNYHFAQAIRTNMPPFLDVYRGVAMSIVGPLAYRSALADSGTIEVPDFRDRSVREQYRADDWSPDPAQRRPGQPWPSVLGDIQPSEEALAYAQQVWEESRYGGMAA